MTKLTRRQLVVAVAGSAPAVASAAAAGQESATRDALLAEARETVNRSVTRLEEFELHRSAAPAFIFQP